MNQKQSWEEEFKKIKVFKVKVRSHYGMDLHDYSTFYTDKDGVIKINKPRTCRSHQEDISSDLVSIEEIPLNTIIKQAIQTREREISEEVCRIKSEIGDKNNAQTPLNEVLSIINNK